MFCWVLIRKSLGVSVVVDSMDVLLGFNPEVSVVVDSMDVLLGFNPEFEQAKLMSQRCCAAEAPD